MIFFFLQDIQVLELAFNHIWSFCGFLAGIFLGQGKSQRDLGGGIEERHQSRGEWRRVITAEPKEVADQCLKAWKCLRRALSGTVFSRSRL